MRLSSLIKIMSGNVKIVYWDRESDVSETLYVGRSGSVESKLYCSEYEVSWMRLDTEFTDTIYIRVENYVKIKEQRDADRQYFRARAKMLQANREKRGIPKRRFN